MVAKSTELSILLFCDSQPPHKRVYYILRSFVNTIIYYLFITTYLHESAHGMDNLVMGLIRRFENVDNGKVFLVVGLIILKNKITTGVFEW